MQEAGHRLTPQRLGQVRRGEAHGNPVLGHRSVQVLMVDDAEHALLATL